MGKATAPFLAIYFSAAVWAPHATALPNLVDYTGIRNVGIIAATGSNVSLVGTGVTVFQNSQANFTWNSEERLTDWISASIRKRFNIVPTPADMDKIQSIALEKNPDAKELESYFSTLTVSNSADAYIVVVPSTAHPMGFMFDGFGITRRSGLFTSESILFANYAVLIVDAKTGKIQQWSKARLIDGDPHSGLAAEPCDGSAWIDGPDAEQKKTLILNELENLVRVSLSKAMKNLGLPTTEELNDAHLGSYPACHPIH